MTVSVLVADDNPIVRMGLGSLLELEDAIVVVAEADSGPEALELTRQHQPDVVLLDVRMPGGSGLQVVGEIAQLARVLMLTHSDEPAVVSRALRSGATGYLVHGTFGSEELALAIRDTAAGAARLSPPAAAVLVSTLESAVAEGNVPPLAPGGVPEPRSPLSGSSGDPGVGVQAAPDSARWIADEVTSRYRLSEREREVSSLMVRGMTNPEIATKLFIAEKTVKNHVNRLFAKLGVSSRPAAIAVLNGVVGSD